MDTFYFVSNVFYGNWWRPYQEGVDPSWGVPNVWVTKLYFFVLSDLFLVLSIKWPINRRHEDIIVSLWRFRTCMRSLPFLSRTRVAESWGIWGFISTFIFDDICSCQAPYHIRLPPSLLGERRWRLTTSEIYTAPSSTWGVTSGNNIIFTMSIWKYIWYWNNPPGECIWPTQRDWAWLPTLILRQRCGVTQVGQMIYKLIVIWKLFYQIDCWDCKPKSDKFSFQWIYSHLADSSRKCITGTKLRPRCPWWSTTWLRRETRLGFRFFRNHSFRTSVMN